MNTRLCGPWPCSPVRTSVIGLRCWNGRFLTSEATGVEHLRFHSPPPSYGGGGPRRRCLQRLCRRGRASVAVQADFRSEIFEDRLCGLPPPPPSGAPPPSYATALTHLPGGGHRRSKPRLDCPRSAAVKLRQVCPAKYFQGNSAISSRALPVTRRHA